MRTRRLRSHQHGRKPFRAVEAGRLRHVPQHQRGALAPLPRRVRFPRQHPRPDGCGTGGRLARRRKGQAASVPTASLSRERLSSASALSCAGAQALTAMSDDKESFASSALVGMAIGVILLEKLVKKGVLSAAEVSDLADEALLLMERWQSAFPSISDYFEEARQLASMML